MKVPQLALVLPATAVLLVSGCDRSAQQAEALKLAEERASLERDKASLAAAQAAAQQSANDAERARLDAQRADLNRQQGQLDAQRSAQFQADQDARRAADRRADKEAEARREADARQAEKAHAGENVSYFYDTLDPYGDWVQVDGYGYAFRPNSGRDPGWRPYTDGDWIYTDYGWTWRSDEPFGWATYHYGRWTRAPRVGWIWVPGTEWAPAWVSWRNGSDYVGWAPLPPEASSPRGFNASVEVSFDIGPGLYSFLRIGDMGERSYVGRVVEPSQNVTIINQTTNITNVTYKTVENRTTIVNEGPQLAVINQQARQPVRQMRVERLEAGAPQPARVQGNTLQMVAPVIPKNPAPGAPVKPRQVKETVTAADWAGARAQNPRTRAEAPARQAEQVERAVAPKPAAPVNTAPAVPPTPFRPAKPTPATPRLVPVEQPAPVPQSRPIAPAPSVASLPEVPAAPSNPPAPKPFEAPVSPKGDKHGKHKEPALPPQTEVAPREVAPQAPAESHQKGHDKHADAPRGENVPWNRPQQTEGRPPQARPGAMPVSPDAQADPNDKDGKHKKKHGDKDN
jgi:hypothetical protein